MESPTSAYLSLHHIFHTHARSTHGKSVIYLNNATLTVIYELVSGNYLNFLVLTTYDGSDSSETIFLRIVNDLHAVVLDF